MEEEDTSDFEIQFSQIRKELNPVIYNIIDEKNFGDTVVLFYFAALIKGVLNKMDDKDIKESVLRFMFDE